MVPPANSHALCVCKEIVTEIELHFEYEETVLLRIGFS
jgi:hypothetical protein